MYHSQNAERRLAMTFQMSQALNILQMSHFDLEQYVQEEIEKNPLLDELKKESIFLDYEIATQTSAYEYLSRQICETFLNPEDKQLAEKMLDSLDERGFLVYSISEEQERNVLATLQTLHPPGIFAQTLQESFLIQLEAKGLKNSAAYKLIEKDYEHFLNQRYGVLKKSYPNLSDILKTLSSLQSRPLHCLKSEEVCPIVPELYIRETESGWLVGMCDECMPRFRLEYTKIRCDSKEERKTIDFWRASGNWLMNAIARRREIILQIAGRIAHHQSEFLAHKGNLKVYTVLDLAQELELHESTISRALSEKYVETPRGIITLKSLLTTTPQKREAKEILQELIAKETTPLTDDQLAQALKEKGFEVARRTISKYRTEMKIPAMNVRNCLKKNCTIPRRSNGAIDF
jgi:RNA polymerase sigma-54 factor